MWTIFSINLFPLTKKSAAKLNFLLNEKSRKTKALLFTEAFPENTINHNRAKIVFLFLNWQNNPERAKRKEEILD